VPTPPAVPAPGCGLGSNSNYFLYSNCDPLLDVSVTITLTEKMTCTSVTDPPQEYLGFSFQLNAYSPQGEAIQWQQYEFELQGSNLFPQIQKGDNPALPEPTIYWPAKTASYMRSFGEISVPRAGQLPAGYQLKIALENAGFWRTSWDLAVSGGWRASDETDDSGLLLYDRTAGVGAFYAVDGKGRMRLLNQHTDWRTTWDLAVSGGWGQPDDSGLLLYDRTARVGQFFTVNSEGDMTPLNEYAQENAGFWEKANWDLIVTGGWGQPDESGLLLYDRTAGVGAFYSVTAEGRMIPHNEYTNWPTTWDLAVTGGWGRPHDSGLLLYDRTAGVGAFCTVSAEGVITQLNEYAQENAEFWQQRSWDLAVTGGWGQPGESGLLLYDQTAGVGAFYTVTAEGRMIPHNEYTNWRTTWDLAGRGGWGRPLDSGLLLYDRAAGVGAFYRVNAEGVITLLLQYDGSVIGATFEVIDEQGKTLSKAPVLLQSLTPPSVVDPILGAQLAPISTFQLNIVATGGGSTAILSSGAGTIVYAASTPLTALSYEPLCAELQGPTAEIANTVYGLLPAGSSNTFTQTFSWSDQPPIDCDGMVFSE
jgi:hypothetical protein